MTVSVALAGEKGGIGKTTLAFHLACHLAENGHRVLAVDLDPQGNLTYTISGTHQDRVRRVVVQEWPLEAATYVHEEYDGRLHLLGGNKSTGDVRNYLAAGGSHLDALKPLLEQTREAGFDFVVLDTPPSPAIDSQTGKVLDALIAPAFYATDFILAPVILEQLPMAGLAALSATLDVLQDQGGTARLLGVVPVMYDGRTSEHAMNLRELVNLYERLVYPIVSRAIAVSRCPAYGMPVWAFEPHNQASHQLRVVAERMVQDVAEIGRSPS